MKRILLIIFTIFSINFCYSQNINDILKSNYQEVINIKSIDFGNPIYDNIYNDTLQIGYGNMYLCPMKIDVHYDNIINRILIEYYFEDFEKMIDTYVSIKNDILRKHEYCFGINCTDNTQMLFFDNNSIILYLSTKDKYLYISYRDNEFLNKESILVKESFIY